MTRYVAASDVFGVCRVLVPAWLFFGLAIAVGLRPYAIPRTTGDYRTLRARAVAPCANIAAAARLNTLVTSGDGKPVDLFPGRLRPRQSLACLKALDEKVATDLPGDSVTWRPSKVCRRQCPSSVLPAPLTGL